MANEITNSEDTLDVRQIIKRFEELEEERQELVDAIEESGDDEEEPAATKAAAEEALSDWDGDEGEEMKLLEDLLDSLRGYGGDHQWKGSWYPVTLVRDSYFEDYAQELVSDIGDLPKDIPSYLVIDWEATARNIQVDYSSVEFDGVTYWYR